MDEITACLFLLYANGNDRIEREKLMIEERDKNCYSKILRSEKGNRILKLSSV